MPNRAYEAGNRFEKRVADRLRSDGYQVWQSRGSKSAADLICLKVGQVLLVQVKSGLTTLDHDQWNGLLWLGNACGAIPLIAERAGRQIAYRRILDWHVARSRAWPATSWWPDYIEKGTPA